LMSQKKKMKDLSLRNLKNPYTPLFGAEKCALSLKNGYLWEIY
jgi:hypothetical protein